MITGAPWNGQMNQYPIADSYAESLFTGDPVMTADNGTIIIAPAGPVLGVFMGCTYLNTSGVLVTSAYWPANTATFRAQGAQALIVDDPNVLFDIQVSNNGNTISGIQAADINNNFSFAVAGNGGGATNPAAGSTITGQSAYYLDYATIANTAALSLKAMALTPYPGNIFATTTPAVVGTGAYNNVLVILNNHILKGGTGTAGV
jgi:hypothetical protein